MIRGIITILTVSILGSGAIMAQQTQKLTASKHNEYGLIYTLPITHLKIDVTAEKTIKTAGPYFKYAKKYLGNENAIVENAEIWSLKDVEITPYGVPDRENEYLMQFKNGSAPFLTLNKAGLPTSINIMVDESATSTVATPIPLLPSKDKRSKSMVMSGEMLTSQSTAKKAELAANQIYKIRESRTNILTGEADQMPPDGDALKIVIDGLNSQEEALTAMFMGSERKETVTQSFDYVPNTTEEQTVIFRLSDFKGIVDRNDLSGEPVYLNLKITEKGELPVNEKGEVKKLPKGAVIYKIPGKAQVALKYNGKTLLDKSVQVAQFGVDFGLDPGMFTDKKQPAYVLFYPETGAIKEIGTTTPQNEK